MSKWRWCFKKMIKMSAKRQNSIGNVVMCCCCCKTDKEDSSAGSQTSLRAKEHANKIENVVDWDAIAKKYRALIGIDSDDATSVKGSQNNEKLPEENADNEELIAAQLATNNVLPV